jgi:prepilin-type N-terminal cleavage/methylation domain-containing protein
MWHNAGKVQKLKIMYHRCLMGSKTIETWGKAFSLVELMVVVLILGSLAFVVVPRLSEGTTTANKNICKTNIDIIQTKLELNHARTGSWPGSLKKFQKDTDHFPEGPPECPFGVQYKWKTKGGAYKVRRHNNRKHGLKVSDEDVEEDESEDED